MDDSNRPHFIMLPTENGKDKTMFFFFFWLGGWRRWELVGEAVAISCNYQNYKFIKMIAALDLGFFYICTLIFMQKIIML